MADSVEENRLRAMRQRLVKLGGDWPREAITAARDAAIAALTPITEARDAALAELADVIEARDEAVVDVRALLVSAKANVDLNSVPGDAAAQDDLDDAIVILDALVAE